MSISQNQMHGRMGGIYSSMLSGASFSVFLIGKYQSTLLIAISYDANNKLVPLAFALVEKENNDSWGWFLRLAWIHVVGPGREVGVISDRHHDILNAVRE